MVGLTYGVAGLLFGRDLVPSPDKKVDVSKHKPYPTVLSLVSRPTAYRYLIRKKCNRFQKHMTAVKHGIQKKKGPSENSLTSRLRMIDCKCPQSKCSQHCGSKFETTLYFYQKKVLK